MPGAVSSTLTQAATSDRPSSITFFSAMAGAGRARGTSSLATMHSGSSPSVAARSITRRITLAG